MNCEFCGAQNSDNAKFCKMCGNKINNNPAARGSEGLYHPPDEDPGGGSLPPDKTQAEEYIIQSAPPKNSGRTRGGKKSPAGKIFIIAGSVVILLGVTAIIFSLFYKRAWAQLFVSDQTYASRYVESYAVGLTDQLLTDAVISDALLSAVNPSAFSLSRFMGNMEQTVSLNARTDAEFLRDIMDIMAAADSEDENAYSLANIISNSGLSFDLRSSVLPDKFLALLSGKWTISGTDLLSLNAAIDENTFYLSAPDLYSKDLAIDLTEMYEIENTLEQLEDLRQAKENAAPYMAKLRAMSRDMVEAAVKEMSFSLDKNASMLINGHEAKFHLINIAEEDFLKGQTAAINVITDSEEYVQLLVDLANIYSADEYDSNQIRDMLINFSAESTVGQESGDSGLLVGLCVNSGNRVMGYQLRSGDALQVNAGAVIASGYELQAAIANSSERTDVRVFGDLNAGTGGAGGTINLSVQGDAGQDVNIELGTFSGLTLKEYNGVPTPNVNLDLTLDPVWRELEETANTPYDISKFLSLLADSHMKLNIGAEGKTVSTSAVLSVSDKFELTLDYSGESDTAENTLPSYDNPQYIDVTNPMNGIDMGELLTNAMTLLGKLNDAGYDTSSLLNNLFYGAS
ncbi:MAG: zinc ribbon domain-containing protein [Clostridiales bacterium]|jgi:hypothetical protein|nr:zinc ribbon domain-containing protein [Clostridiales bacterium]